ncbi:16580_t:CDS:2 [Acaulospora colombiana]|uniref:16580_t:CDS:1 n=1 Tax=Acaulospora colombiana TaxID=27376 RepID=A0ACA9KIN8_9GLOM|nr:16580_t:CDS:2 [Acaulospora colombiana]
MEFREALGRRSLKTFEEGNNPKKRLLSLNSTPNFSLSSNDLKSATYGYGPPFLFSLPEPVEDPWKFKSSPALRKIGARPLSANALRRRRRAMNLHLHGSQQINPEDMYNEEMNENIESIDEKPDRSGTGRSNSNDDWVHKLSRVPALEDACKRWEKYPFQEFKKKLPLPLSIVFLNSSLLVGTCMNRDPTVFARAKVSAEAFGEIINNLMEQFSYKTMLFMVAIVIAIFVSRALVDLFKTRFLNDFTRSIPHDVHPSPAPMTPMQAHSITPIQHHISPGNSANHSMTPQRNSVGVYYVMNPPI